MDPVLRQEIESGSYRVDAECVAAAIVARMARRPPSAVLVAAQPADPETVGAEQPEACAPFHEA
jgi:hypothetical protein